MSDARQATQLHELTASDAAALIRRRAISPVELVQQLLARAAAVEPTVHAWVTLDPERALTAAQEAEQAVTQTGAPLPPLHGVPFGVKDIFDTAGLRTSAGFAPYANRIPRTDAEPVARLKHAGGIVLGKMVTTQFAFADPSPARNPWSPERTPGGSSSGSAAGVAARAVPIAFGSQTAGSVLRPAAFNGVVGLKPTYGRISKRGVFPLAWSLDHTGVLARSVDDCAVFLSAVAGYDPLDPASVDQPVPSFAIDTEPQAPRLGLVREAIERTAPRVRQHVMDLAHAFESAGATVAEVSLGEPLDLIVSVHHAIMQTETAAAHWQLLEQHPGMHAPRIRAYVEVGRLLPGILYLHAQRLRRRIRASMARTLASVDALLLPTAHDVAPTLETTGDPSLQAPFSLVGFPSISLPSGLLEMRPTQRELPQTVIGRVSSQSVEEPERLPLAIQLVGPAWQEQRLLSVARWCEAQLPPMPAPPLPA